jgi:cytochrome P450
MSRLADMALPYLPVELAAFDADPFPLLAAARTEHPWLARFREGYFIHGYQAIKDLTSMDAVLRPSFDGVVDFYGARGTDWGRFMEENIIAISGARHVRIRNSIALAFTPRSINRYRGVMRGRISQLLDDWASQGAFDFAEFAAFFPISVLCGLLGTSTAELPRIHAALEAQGRVFSLDRALLPELLAGHEVMREYVDQLVKARERSGSDAEEGLLDNLIASKNAGDLSELELRDLLLVLFPAGYDTSKNALAFTVYTLLQYPGHWERCAADPQYCAQVVEEMLRYSSTASPFRTVADEFVYDGVAFPIGARLFFGNPVAGRDPAAFPRADTFQPGRSFTNHHIAFGRGAHICVGQHLARAQMAEGLHVVARRLRNPRLSGEVKWRPFLGTWGPRSLPIAFDPAPAEAQANA